VAFNRGVSFFPLLSTQHGDNENIKYLRCLGPEPKRKVVLIFHRSDPMRKKYEILRNAIARYMERYFIDFNTTAQA